MYIYRVNPDVYSPLIVLPGGWATASAAEPLARSLRPHLLRRTFKVTVTVKVSGMGRNSNRLCVSLQTAGLQLSQPNLWRALFDVYIYAYIYTYMHIYIYIYIHIHIHI